MAGLSRADQLKGKYIDITKQKALTAQQEAFFEAVAHCLITIDIEMKELKAKVNGLDKASHPE